MRHVYLAASGVIGSEFLPHLDEGAIWVRGTLAPSTGPTEGIRIANQARVVLASFPEVTIATSQVGRPDDGTDFTGFFNTEYCVDLKPKEKWRPVFHENKEKLIAAMNRELQKIPGVIWNFSQPIADNMEEAVSGVKGQLATKIYGDDLKVLEAKGEEIISIMRHVNGHQGPGLFRVIGQPNLNFVVDREQAARYQINVADVQDAVQTAVGGNAAHPGAAGRAALRPGACAICRSTATRRRPSKTSVCSALPASGCRSRSSARWRRRTARREIYREGNQRYVAIKYSVRGRDLGSTVEEAMEKVSKQVKLPAGYHIEWAGEYESQKRAEARLLIIVPLTIFLIFIIIYGAFGSVKWACLNLVNVAMAPHRRACWRCS